jgi:hypothetical protein
MLLQGLRQCCSRGSHACGKRRRPSVVNRAQCSSAPRDELVHLLGPASGLSSCQWSNDEPREAMLPQPQYEGDWEIQAEEEDQQERIGAKDREGEDKGEEGDVFGGGQTPHRPGAFATDHATPAASRGSGADSYKESYQDEYWERPGIVQATSRCPALVLNQDLTPLTLFPLTIAPWWSAVRSTLRGRVSVLSSYDRGVRSTHALHQLPSVVALTRQQTPGQRRQAGALEGREGEAGCKAGGGRGEGGGERRFWPAARTPRPFRRNVALRDGYVCCFCGRRLSYRTLTLDHVVPRCLGGEDSWENLASACRQCNSRKGSLLVSELGRIDMRLLRAPYAPTALQVSGLGDCLHLGLFTHPSQPRLPTAGLRLRRPPARRYPQPVGPLPGRAFGPRGGQSERPPCHLLPPHPPRHPSLFFQIRGPEGAGRLPHPLLSGRRRIKAPQSRGCLSAA